MELKETIEDMISDDYRRRYVAEYKQLTIRIEKLVEYIKKHLTNDNSMEVYLKNEQLKSMLNYRNVLEMRAKIENIDLTGAEYRQESTPGGVSFFS